MSGPARPVLVTGAGGFIATRLIEQLRNAVGDCGVRALVHRPNGAVRVAKYGIDIVAGDMTDDALVDRAVDGVSAVVHCAYDPVNVASNVAGADTLARACLRFGVDNVVHVSSLSVYEPLGDQLVTESSATVATGWVYADTKLEVEQRFEHWHRQEGLPVVILQPTIVYGPFSNTWTSQIAHLLKYSRIVLPDDGSGNCHPVFVDDVAESIMLAISARPLAGRRFLITGPAPVTWRDFFAAYEAVLGTDSVRFRPKAELQAMLEKPVSAAGIRTALLDPARVLESSALKSARSFATRCVPGLGPWVQQRLPTPQKFPNPQQLALYSSTARVSGDAAKRDLGYVPKTTFSDGMAITAQYMKWANL